MNSRIRRVLAFVSVAFGVSFPAFVSALSIDSVSPRDFGSVLVGGAPEVEMVLVTNDEPVSLVITGLSITGTNAGDFGAAFSGSLPVVLAANASASLTLSFAPTASGSRSADLAILSGSQTLATLSLVGLGVPEPSTIALLAVGPLGLALVHSRSRLFA